MTVVGKILVFLNLVFSLLVGGLVIFAYTTRTNWYDFAQKHKTAREATEANRKQIIVDVDRTKQDADKWKTLYDKEKVARNAEVVRLTDQLNAEKRKVKDAQAIIDVANLNVDTQQVVGNTREQEVKAVLALLEKKKEQNALLETDLVVAQDAQKLAELKAATARARAASLEQDLKDAIIARDRAVKDAELAKRRSVERADSDNNPPGVPIEGRVLSVNDTTIQISLGIDHGIKEGHTLEVFRLGDKPKYLGKVQIIRVTTRGALARRMKDRPDKIVPGDRVADRIRVGG